MNNLLPSAFDYIKTTNTYFHPYNTSQSQNIHIPLRKTVSGQPTISFRGSKLWNQLNNKIKEAYSVQSFKNNMLKKIFDNTDIS